MENGVWYILAALIMGWTGFCIYKGADAGAAARAAPTAGNVTEKKREKRNKLYLYL